jgi:uncharacterized protein YecE (DUF72 family)
MTDKPDNLIFIGTSGWSYPDWQEFYQAKLKSSDQLAFYSKFFKTTEYNRSFYNWTRPKTLLNFKNSVPSDFIFALKAHQQITHINKLKDTMADVTRFMDTAAVLGNQLGPVLFQLPPKLAFDPVLLEKFINRLPQPFRYTIEFRNPSWHRSETYALLLSKNIAFCIYDLGSKKSPHAITADFIYIRLHGERTAYKDAYDDDTLYVWSRFIRQSINLGKRVYCYFDNSIGGYAPLDALKLLSYF